MSGGHADWNQQIIDTFRANNGVVPQFGRSLIRDGEDTWLIAASKAGAPDNPAWYHNLLAHPDVDIETPDGVVPVRAEELTGAEREAAWAKFTVIPTFAEYQRNTTRTIPVLALRRRPA